MANPEKFIVSDTHFSHNNILTFTNDGKPIREFSSIEEMDETIIENWNKVVRQQDVVYHLGDVVINKRFLHLIERCNGSKRLIKGNHDVEKDEKYLPYFKTIYAMRIFKDMILTHFPIHEDTVGRFKLNCHGHTHFHSMHSPHYMNMCVDFPGDGFYPAMNYTPRHIDDVRLLAKQYGVL